MKLLSRQILLSLTGHLFFLMFFFVPSPSKVGTGSQHDNTVQWLTLDSGQNSFQEVSAPTLQQEAIKKNRAKPIAKKKPNSVSTSQALKALTESPSDHSLHPMASTENSTRVTSATATDNGGSDLGSSLESSRVSSLGSDLGSTLPSSAGSPSGTTQKSDDTLRLIRQRIFTAKRYPVIAKEQGVEGVVTLLFSINPEGRLDQLQVTKTSGSPLLDRAALDTIKRATPFPSYQKPIQLSLKYDLDEGGP